MLTNLITGPPSSLITAALRIDPDDPPVIGDRHQITFSSQNTPDLPSLVTEVVWVPENPVFDCSPEFTGLAVFNGWATVPTVATGAYTTLSTDSVILANSASAAFTVTLADATGPGFSPGQRVTVIKTDSSANVVTVTGTSGQLINGATTVTLAGQYATLSVVFDGVATTNWLQPSAGGGGGGSPTGSAGGALSGTYPNPGLAVPLALSGSGNNFGTLVQVTNTHTNPNQTPVGFTAAASGDKVLGVQVTGDAGSRWRVLATGEQDWGTGSTPDTNLYRAAANVLQTDDTFNAVSGLQAGGVAVGTSWQPADNGWLVANADPVAAGNAQLTSTSTVYLQKLSIHSNMTISTLTWICTVAGAGSSTGTFAGLYTSSGTKLTGSSDVGTNFAATGAIACTLTTPQALTAGTFVWAALLVNLGTTQPTLARLPTSSTIANAGLTAATFRWATNGTGTTLPGSITPSSNGTTTSTWFVAGS